MVVAKLSKSYRMGWGDLSLDYYKINAWVGMIHHQIIISPLKLIFFDDVWWFIVFCCF